MFTPMLKRSNNLGDRDWLRRSSFFQFFLFSSFAVQPLDAVVGYGHKEYPGYRKMTRADLMNRGTRRRLLLLHARRAGFPLAESPLSTRFVLMVAEGAIEVGRYRASVASVDGSANNVFAARYCSYEVGSTPWTVSPPLPDDEWNVRDTDTDTADAPCLFVRSAHL